MTDRQQYPAEVRERAVAIVREYLGQPLYRVVDDLALRLTAAEAENADLRRQLAEAPRAVVPAQAEVGGRRFFIDSTGRELPEAPCLTCPPESTTRAKAETVRIEDGRVVAVYRCDAGHTWTRRFGDPTRDDFLTSDSIGA